MGHLFETHFHTAETSGCGMVPAAEGVRAYSRQGNAGIVVTDHFFREYFAALPEGLSWPEKVDS